MKAFLESKIPVFILLLTALFAFLLLTSAGCTWFASSKASAPESKQEVKKTTKNPEPNSTTTTTKTIIVPSVSPTAVPVYVPALGATVTTASVVIEEKKDEQRSTPQYEEEQRTTSAKGVEYIGNQIDKFQGGQITISDQGALIAATSFSMVKQLAGTGSIWIISAVVLVIGAIAWYFGGGWKALVASIIVAILVTAIPSAYQQNTWLATMIVIGILVCFIIYIAIHFLLQLLKGKNAQDLNKTLVAVGEALPEEAAVLYKKTVDSVSSALGKKSKTKKIVTAIKQGD